ncbi:MAG: amidohydrolase family protein [Capsulimonadaceae bacterium]|nr:amidohydrolase family protein [Capsulimonadaceae bacterium]
MSTRPQYRDLQVNGYGGVDFNQDNLSLEAVERACAKLSSDGVESVLATIITEELGVMASRISRLARIVTESPQARRVIQGFHIEGPFISPETGYRGAHPLDAVRPAELDAMKRLLDAGDGLVRIVTLAPECDNHLRVTRWLTEHGIVVAAGHCNPSLEQLTEAADAGISAFTHLGNGCPMLLSRHDNIIQRALSLSDRLWCCFIADGVHVPFPALRNYIRAAGVERCVVVTDGTAPAGLGPGRYTFSRWDVTIGDDLAAWAPDGSHLLGSACTMSRAADNLIKHCGFTESETLTMTRTNPGSVLDLAKSAFQPR